jgi:hypothetical protein
MASSEQAKNTYDRGAVRSVLSLLIFATSGAEPEPVDAESHKGEKQIYISRSL